MAFRGQQKAMCACPDKQLDGENRNETEELRQSCAEQCRAGGLGW